MASEDTKYPKIRISPEAKAILDKGKTSPSKKIDEWLGINKTETPQKVYENPETHLLDHAIILALFETSKTDNLVKREAKMWETLLDGGTEHFIREEDVVIRASSIEEYRDRVDEMMVNEAKQKGFEPGMLDIDFAMPKVEFDAKG